MALFVALDLIKVHAENCITSELQGTNIVLLSNLAGMDNVQSDNDSELLESLFNDLGVRLLTV